MVDKKIIKIIRKSKYWQAEGPALMKMCEAPMMSICNMAKYNKGLKYSPVFFFVKKGYGHQFMDENDSINLILFHIKKGEKYIKEKISLWRMFEKKTFTIAGKVDNIDLSKLTDKNLWNLYKNFQDYLINVWCVTAFLDGNGIYFEKVLIPKICKETGISESEAISKAVILTTPEKSSFSKNEYVSLLKIVLEFVVKNISLDTSIENLKNKYGEIYELLKNHQEKFYWVRNNYKHVSKITEEEFLKEIKTILAGKNIKQIKEELFKNQDIKGLRQKKIEVKKGFKISKALEEEIKIFSVFGWWQDERKRINLHSLQYVALFLNEIARRMALTFEEINNVTDKEVEDFLIKRVKPDIKIIKEREEIILHILFDNKKYKIFSGGEAEIYFQEVLKSTNGVKQNAKEIKGYVACMGGKDELSGKIRIVLDVKKDKFEEGYILVTSMTRPEFVPLMKRARAIVTNEGGITSHAAIISRELGTPCIIGTKNATQILKNNNKIKLDLKKGLIKIIK